jgi:hypothetical protein
MARVPIAITQRMATMPYTVAGAFEKFRKDAVDLDPDDSDRARSSRDYLYDQAKGLSISDIDFPTVYYYIPFGSFARKTKIRPLDDIDLLFMLNGNGTSSRQSLNDQYTYWLKIDNDSAPLAKFRDTFGYVSSTRLLNQLKKSLGKVKNYARAELKRTGEAVVLNLTSYTWVFDIVPAVPIANSFNKSEYDYFLIPNGNGNWMRTDPRKDTEYVTRVNRQQDGLLLPTMRLLKYWNARIHKPRLPSYYFETVVLHTLNNASKFTSYPAAIQYFFNVGSIYLNLSCSDPKGLGPNLDKDVDGEMKRKVSHAMKDAHSLATSAVVAELMGSHGSAMEFWQKVFGSTFPLYG